jgi:hypothetical protein
MLSPTSQGLIRKPLEACLAQGVTLGEECFFNTGLSLLSSLGTGAKLCDILVVRVISCGSAKVDRSQKAQQAAVGLLSVRVLAMR